MASLLEPYDWSEDDHVTTAEALEQLADAYNAHRSALANQPRSALEAAEARADAELETKRVRIECDHKESARAYHVHIEPRAPGRPAKVTSIETCQACGAELSRNESGGDPHA